METKSAAWFCLAICTRSDNDRNESSLRVRKALIPGSRFSRSASVLAKASVTSFSWVFVSTPIAPVSMPPWPASTATMKSPDSGFAGAGMALVVCAA
jgi:hypothetical protein